MTARGRRTLVDEVESTREGQLGMAAARAAVEAVALINRAVDTSGLSQVGLSSRLGLTEGRVSQVVNGDGNLRVSTLARFVRAAGYRLRLTVEPAEPGVRALPERAPRRRTAPANPLRYAAVTTVTTCVGGAVGPEHVVHRLPSHPHTIVDVGQSFTYDVIFDMTTGECEVPAKAETPGPVVARQTGQDVRHV